LDNQDQPNGKNRFNPMVKHGNQKELGTREIMCVNILDPGKQIQVRFKAEFTCVK